MKPRGARALEHFRGVGDIPVQGVATCRSRATTEAHSAAASADVNGFGTAGTRTVALAGEAACSTNTRTAIKGDQVDH